MQNTRNVRGITMIGFLIVLGVLGFFAYIAMRLIPVYTEYYGVTKSMDLVAKEPGSALKTTDQIRSDLSLKFSIQYVEDNSVPPQAIQVNRQGGGAILRIAYQRRVPFISNIELLISFDRSVPLSGAGAY